MYKQDDLGVVLCPWLMMSLPKTMYPRLVNTLQIPHIFPYILSFHGRSGSGLWDRPYIPVHRSPGAWWCLYRLMKLLYIFFSLYFLISYFSVICQILQNRIDGVSDNLFFWSDLFRRQNHLLAWSIILLFFRKGKCFFAYLEKSCLGCWGVWFSAEKRYYSFAQTSS